MPSEFKDGMSPEEIRTLLPAFKFERGADQKDDGLTEFKNKVTLEDGSEYEGQWNKLSGEKQGQGTMWYADGSIFDGCWQSDKPNGRGRLTKSNGDIYEGEWKDGNVHGYGVYKHAKNEGQYVGEWQDHKQHGHGIETWADGTKFEG